MSRDSVISTAATLDAADATINAKGARVDAVILDVGMPDGDGCDFCDILRRKGHKIPIIMLTGLNSEEDVVRGLEAGASDYVAKPFRFNELFARLRTQLRIFDETSDAAFTIGPYIFRPSAKTLQDSMTDRRSRLTEKEAAILKYLYRADTKPVAREILMQLVWGYEFQRIRPCSGDPHLPPAPENGARSDQSGPFADRGQRLSPGPADGSRGRIGYLPSLKQTASAVVCGWQRHLACCVAGGRRRQHVEAVDRRRMTSGPLPAEATMPIVRNIDVTMQSEISFDDACRAAVAEAAKTLRGIMSFRIKEAECVVEHDKIIAFRVTGKIVFLVER